MAQSLTPAPRPRLRIVGAEPAPGDAAQRAKRANGEGSIYQAADGRWRGSVAWKGPDGRQGRRYVSGRTQAEVRKAVAALTRELDAGRPPVAGGTVAAYLDRWLATARADIRPSTWRQRDQSMRSYVIPALGTMRLDRVRPSDIERMTTGMVERGLSPRTAALARVILRKALADALRDGLVGRNVAALARPPRQVHREIEYLDPPALRRLMDGSADHPLGPIITLAASTGLRQGELLGLTWADVDLDARRIDVRRSLARSWGGGYALAEPKTARSRRSVDLTERAIAALRTERERQDARRAVAGPDWLDRDGLVFTDATGAPLDGTAVMRGYQTILRSLGMPHRTFHALRHSYATALLAAGVPLKVVSDALGHTTIAITADTYAHVVPELRRDAADAFARIVG